MTTNSGRDAAPQHGAILAELPHHRVRPRHHLRGDTMVPHRRRPLNRLLHLDPALLPPRRARHEAHRERVALPVVLSHLRHGAGVGDGEGVWQERRVCTQVAEVLWPSAVL